MTATSELWVFAGLIVLGQFSPGPDMVLLTRTALREGWRSGVKMAFGIASGLAVHSSIAVAGVAVMFQRLPTLRLLLQWLAAFYLVWLAYGLLKAALQASVPAEVPASRHSPFLRGLLCNLCNPKAALFLAAVCAPFLAGSHPPWWAYALWGVIVGLGIVLWSAWVMILQWPPIRLRYVRAGRWIDGIFAIALTALAIRLIVGW